MRGGETLPARVYRPSAHRGRLPGWLVLHGLTRTGTNHPGLHRFTTALAASGSLVFVPEIPEWRDLRVAPALTIETIRSAVRALQKRDDVVHERVGLLGFSFGATQALIAATDPEIAAMLHGMAAWGGYADVGALFEFGMTGTHQLDGITYRIQPDPYGSWIMAGNYLTSVPGHEGDGEVAHEVQALAIAAGDTGFYAWDPVFDAQKHEARQRLRPAQRELFDMIAPLTTDTADPSPRKLELGRALAAAAVRVDPLLDPQPFLSRTTVPVLLAHGRDDRVIPFTQSILLQRSIPSAVLRRCTVTGLFAHSGGTIQGMPARTRAAEALRFAALLRALINHA